MNRLTALFAVFAICIQSGWTLQCYKCDNCGTDPVEKIPCASGNTCGLAVTKITNSSGSVLEEIKTKGCYTAATTCNNIEEDENYKKMIEAAKQKLAKPGEELLSSANCETFCNSDFCNAAVTMYSLSMLPMALLIFAKLFI